MHICQSFCNAAAGFFLAMCVAASALGDVQPLPLTPGVQPSAVYRVFVNDREIPVGVEQPADNRPVESAAFQFTGKADVRITVRDSFKHCQIRPLRFGLTESAKTSTLDGHREIRFSLGKPRHLIVELDDLPHLVLIGSPPDDDLPNPNDPNVLYFAAGVHEPGRIRVKSGQTIYLAAGAKVYGTIEGTCVENIRITGHGHLYGTKHTDWNKRTYGIVFDRCRNITIEHIGIRDCYWWTTNFVLCDGLTVRDINLITFNRNNGGLMIDSCQNLTARNCLLMSRDDCICPHALNAAGNGEEPSDNLLFENLVLYNVHDGNGIRIGASFETSEVRNWKFRNIDVVHRAGAAIISDHSDWATVRNLVFENFTDEDPKRISINMFIDTTRYTCQTGYRDARGRFDGLYFIDYRSSGGKIVLEGFDREHGFDNVVFADCWIGDKRVDNIQDIEANEFVRDVRFYARADEAIISPLPSFPPADGRGEAASPAELVIDDGDEKFRAYGFTRQNSPDDAHRGSASIGQVIDKFGQYAAAIYEPQIVGRYEVYAFWGTHRGVDSRSPWIIKHRNGFTRAYLDQNNNPGWHRLGTFDFDADSNIRLVFPNYFEPTKDPVVADAVKFVKAKE